MRVIFPLIICLLIAACQASTADDLPTLPASTVTPRPTLAIIPTEAPRSIAQPPTETFAPTDPPVSVAPVTLFAPADLAAAPTLDTVQVIGVSLEGRAITARHFGSGERAIALIGGMHGGYEFNTVELMTRLIDHFAENPADVPPNAALYIVEAANPDGVARGRTDDARFNANGVDLNRNWACEWSREAFWRQTRVNPGVRAFSEPETQALADWLLELRPAAALFYHSAANGVFAGTCGGDHGSLALARAYADAAGYACCDGFSAYPVTGTAAAWANSQRIPAADVELTVRDDPEFARNLRAVLTLLANDPPF